MDNKLRRDLASKAIIGIVGFIVSVFSYFVATRNEEIGRRLVFVEEHLRNLEIELPGYRAQATDCSSRLSNLEETVGAKGERLSRLEAILETRKYKVNE